jgi:hypothetical protein
MNSELTKTRSKPPQRVSLAAYDEVYAGLPGRALDPAPFRELAADLDRQHERLQQLLRDLDAAAASE